MIGFLKGKIIYRDSSRVIINVKNTGYEVYFRLHSEEYNLHEEIPLYIVQKYSEYGVSLYGFKSIDEKIIFEILDSIKGVGSKAIFAIMNALDITSPSQLKNLKLDELTKVPGVGKSTAQKFLLGLSSKLKKDFVIEDDEPAKSKDKIDVQFKNEIALMVEWGMKKSDIIDFIKENKDSLEGKKSEEIIKFILKNNQ